ncbi:MAG: hypothetical protein HY900_16715, partial [Deltaproteobacteria bacterium]|nr:hypothetical protein [Deltaproteobacteria bacterium]
AWRFPEALVEAVRLHHTPAAARIDPVLVRISHVADALTMTLGVGLGSDGLAYRLDEEAVRALGLADAGKLNDLMEALAVELRKTEALIATVRDERS